MDCSQYRRFRLADPAGLRPDAEEHVRGCAACAAFTADVLRFEGRLSRALQIQLWPSGPARPHPVAVPRWPTPTWMAVAASLIMAVGVAAVLWLAVPRASLAADVVAHVVDEPAAWVKPSVPVSAQALESVLRDARVHLRPGMGTVRYARSCLFRGHFVPHFVLESPQGPVTVIVLVHENISAAQPLNEQGYRGVIVPIAGHGSAAVIARGASQVEWAAQAIVQALDFG
jgi:Protein of unknown function (DUF3379)